MAKLKSTSGYILKTSTAELNTIPLDGGDVSSGYAIYAPIHILPFVFWISPIIDFFPTD